jgi:hypothetical protein
MSSVRIEVGVAIGCEMGRKDDDHGGGIGLTLEVVVVVRILYKLGMAVI